jgi:hypothetical protein
MAFEAVEAFSEWDSESEAAEATRPVRRPSSQPSFKNRPATGAPQFVTQTQLEASLTRVDGKVKTVADGVSTINARLAAMASALKKETDERKKAGDGQNKDLNSKLQMLALLPLLVQPSSKPIDAPSAITSGGQPITSVVVPDSNQTLDSLLPLLMVSGLGGSGGLGLGGDSSGSDNSMMMLALVLAMSNKS